MVNEDTLEHFKGQFMPEEVTEERGAAYTERFSLNRQNGILQFLHGETPTLSFRGRVFNETITGGSFPLYNKRQEKFLAKLLTWVEIDKVLGRPPIIIFWVGNGHVQMKCVIESITGIRYDSPQVGGLFHGASFTVNLRKYTPYSLDATEAFDTRYHYASEGDYYELIAWREYKRADLGVWLRQRQPTQPNLTVGNIVPLPSPGGATIRKAKVTQTSVIFKTSYGKKPTDQRERRLEMLALRNKTQVSHVILPGSGLGG
jgi:hypothetical protein